MIKECERSYSEEYLRRKAAGYWERYRKQVKRRKCKACAQRARKATDTGECLECLARAVSEKHPNGRPWSPEELDVIERWAGHDDWSGLQFRLWRHFRSLRTRTAIERCRSERLGISVDTHLDAVPLGHLADELGVERSTFYDQAARGVITTYGKGRRRWVSYEEAERLRNLYPPLPADPITYPEAASILGYASENYISWLVASGVLRAWNRKHRGERRFWLDAEAVRALAQEMRATGKGLLDYVRPEIVARHRANARTYRRAQRAARRAC